MSFFLLLFYHFCHECVDALSISACSHFHFNTILLDSRLTIISPLYLGLKISPFYLLGSRHMGFVMDEFFGQNDLENKTP